MNKYKLSKIILASILVLIFLNPVFSTEKQDKKKVDHVTLIEETTQPNEIKMNKGKVEGIKLPVQMSTGFSWKVVKLGEHLKQVYKPKIVKPSSKDKVGVGTIEYQIYYFKAIDLGKTSIQFEHRQPFDKETPAEKELTVNIEIVE